MADVLTTNIPPSITTRVIPDPPQGSRFSPVAFVVYYTVVVLCDILKAGWNVGRQITGDLAARSALGWPDFIVDTHLLRNHEDSIMVLGDQTL